MVTATIRRRRRRDERQHQYNGKPLMSCRHGFARAHAASEESGNRHRTTARLRKRRTSHRVPTGYAPPLDSTRIWSVPSAARRRSSTCGRRTSSISVVCRDKTSAIGHRSCYVHGSGSGRWAPHRPVYDHHRPRATMNAAHAAAGAAGPSPFLSQPAPRSTCLVGLRRSLAGSSPGAGSSEHARTRSATGNHRDGTRGISRPPPTTPPGSIALSGGPFRPPPSPARRP